MGEELQEVQKGAVGCLCLFLYGTFPSKTQGEMRNESAYLSRENLDPIAKVQSLKKERERDRGAQKRWVDIKLLWVSLLPLFQGKREKR